MILLRPPHFQSHDVHYIITLDPKAPAGTTVTSPTANRNGRLPYDCRRVPQHLRGLPWRQLLQPAAQSQLTDSLMIHSSGASAPRNIVSSTSTMPCSKFEDPRYTHMYIKRPAGADGDTCTAGGGVRDDNGGGEAARGRLVIELPRYGLEFELAGGRLVSCDYSGYSLGRCQQLEGKVGRPWRQLQEGGGGQQDGEEQAGHDVSYTLPEFQQYLVLESTPGQGGRELGAKCWCWCLRGRWRWRRRRLLPDRAWCACACRAPAAQSSR